MNKEGRKLIEFIEERGWSILNGSIKGDENGDITYLGGRGETIIDYVLGEWKMKERVEKLKVAEMIDSDHYMVVWIRVKVVWIRGKWRKERKREGERRVRKRGVWNEEGRREFSRRIGDVRDVGEKHSRRNR